MLKHFFLKYEKFTFQGISKDQFNYLKLIKSTNKKWSNNMLNELKIKFWPNITWFKLILKISIFFHFFIFFDQFPEMSFFPWKFEKNNFAQKHLKWLQNTLKIHFSMFLKNIKIWHFKGFQGISKKTFGFFKGYF